MNPLKSARRRAARRAAHRGRVVAASADRGEPLLRHRCDPDLGFQGVVPQLHLRHHRERRVDRRRRRHLRDARLRLGGWRRIVRPANGEGQIGFHGSIRFTGHGGVLDTTVANPQLRFLGDGDAVLLLDVVGVTQDGAPIDQKAVEFVDARPGGCGGPRRRRRHDHRGPGRAHPRRRHGVRHLRRPTSRSTRSPRRSPCRALASRGRRRRPRVIHRRRPGSCGS